MRDEGNIIVIIDRDPLGKTHQHRAAGADLTGSDYEAQFAGAHDKNSAQYCPALDHRRKGHRTLVVDCGKTKPIKGPAARAWIASGYELAQQAVATKMPSATFARATLA